jgi:hypothetical protein
MVHATFRGTPLPSGPMQDGAMTNTIVFIGKRRRRTIKGERYARTLKHDKDGRLFKDHWE